MFSFFKSKPITTEATLPLATIEADWHCHLLASIDDGSQSEAETLEMLRKYMRLGIKKIVATPHVHSDYFRNTPHTIGTAYEKAKHLIEQNQLPIELSFAAEYFANDYFLELIAQKQLLTIENQYVLFELSMQQQPLFGRKLVENIQQLGYMPLLAHPERYRYWHSKPKEWQKWKEMGVGFQLNLLSLLGQYGSAERVAAEKMIDLDLIDAVGSDAHGAHHLHKLNGLSTNKYFDIIQHLPLLNKT